MDGREFLTLARRLMTDPLEANRRAAAGRAYYGLMIEARDALHRWGFQCPPRENVHTFVRLRFLYAADAHMKTIGSCLDQLSQLRNRSDYDMSAPHFSTPKDAQDAIDRAADALALLDALDADPARRAAAISDIKKRWP